MFLPLPWIVALSGNMFARFALRKIVALRDTNSGYSANRVYQGAADQCYPADWHDTGDGAITEVVLLGKIWRQCGQGTADR